MTRIDVVVLQGDLRAAVTELGRLGCTHLMPACSAESGDLLEAVDTADRRAESEMLLGRVIALQEPLGLKPEPDGKYERAFPLAEIRRGIGALEGRVGKLREERDKAVQMAGNLRRQEEDLESLAPLPAEAFAPDRLSFVTMRVGWLRLDQVNQLAREADFAVVVPLDRRDDRELVAAIVSRKKRFALQTALEKLGFARQEPPDTGGADPAVALQKHRESRLALLKKIEEIDSKLRGIADSVGREIAGYRNSLETEIALYRAMAQFGKTHFTCVAAGWVPTSDAPRLRDRLLAVTAGRAMVRMHRVSFGDASQAAIPVKARLNPFFKPFRILVSNFGLPTYGEIDPTPFVAISFLVLFGLMFGDLGQGAVLVVLGIFLRWKGDKEFIRDFGFILVAAGISAMIFGSFLYGSVFGKEGVLHVEGLTLDPMKDVTRLFAIAVISGIVLLSAGVILNVVNRFGRRRFYQGTLDKFGLVGLIFYWGMLASAILLTVFGGAPSWLILIVVGVPLILIFLSEPLHFLFSKKPSGEGGGLITTIMEALVAVLETVIAYLANTASFLRVAGFALAHAGLCYAIWKMYESIDMPAIQWPVVVLGNILVIALEGLVASIQCMRLQYYEFFGKFFRGEGKAFKPFRIKAGPGRQAGSDT